MDTERALNHNRVGNRDLENLREAFIEFRNRKNREDQERDRLLAEITALMGPFIEERKRELGLMVNLNNRLADTIDESIKRRR